MIADENIEAFVDAFLASSTTDQLLAHALSRVEELSEEIISIDQGYSHHISNFLDDTAEALAAAIDGSGIEYELNLWRGVIEVVQLRIKNNKEEPDVTSWDHWRRVLFHHTSSMQAIASFNKTIMVDALAYEFRHRVPGPPTVASEYDELGSVYSSLLALESSSLVVDHIECVINPFLVSRFFDKLKTFSSATVVTTFHGTPEINVQSILNEGYRIPGKSGHGIWMATNPITSVHYMQGGKSMMINRVIFEGCRSQSGSGVLIANNTESVLPCFVVRFK